MPMTAAHPMAVLPLRRTNLDWTCLVIGSMAPDFDYFIRIEHASPFSHTLLGMFVFCLPVTIVSAWLFHRVIKRPFVRVMPASVGARMAVFAERPWHFTAGCIVAALVGTSTHLLWDSFTHLDMWGPQHIAWLRKVILLRDWGLRGWGYTRVCRVLQYVSTAVGLVVLGIVAWRALRRVQPRPIAPATLGMRLVWLVCIAIAGVLCFVRIDRMHAFDIGSIVVAIIDAGLFGGFVASLITR